MAESDENTLAHRMRDRAMQCRQVAPDLSDQLLAHANALDAITLETPIPRVVGTWAKARKFWCDLTGEPLV